MQAYERLLHYITFDTASDETKEQTPSTQGQMVLARELAKEMKELGMQEVFVDEHAYTYGSIPASNGCADVAPIGFIAHLDTVNEVPVYPVKIQMIKNYDGGIVPLGTCQKVLDPEKFPHLKNAAGKTLITTDGATLLGSDDKSGIAEIMTMCERLLSSDIPHGKICVCFTPDEEIGHGADLLDLERFGADYAYTVDGSEPELIEYETFNAASAKWSIAGFETHPGSAKDVMINAALVAMEINGMLPDAEIPSKTEGYEGFYHLCAMEGNVSKASLEYIIRDHDPEKFEKRKKRMLEIEKQINEKYGEGTAVLELKDQYRNMEEILRNYPQILERAGKAVKKAGLAPASNPVRGGTDGARLSFRGLPCPNLGTGGYAYHGPYEHVIAEQMDTMVEILVNIAAQEKGVAK